MYLMDEQLFFQIAPIKYTIYHDYQISSFNITYSILKYIYIFP